jgi:hypothetical protein
MPSFRRDLRFALRLARSSPAFSAVAVLTLALGIAVTTTVFSWVDGVLLRPLPGTGAGEHLVAFESVEPDGEGHNVSLPTTAISATTCNWSRGSPYPCIRTR